MLEQGKKHEEGATETKNYELAATFILHPLVLLRGRAGTETEPVKEDVGRKVFSDRFLLLTILLCC